MARYTRQQPRATRAWDIDEDEPFRPYIEVDSNEAVNTGLVWTDGEPIMRTPNPVGFGRDGEW